MADSWTIRLPYRTPPILMNARLHWAAKAKVVRDIRVTASMLAVAARVPSCDTVHVQLIYVPRDRRRRDADGLVATLKPCLDGLVDAHVIADDSPEYVSWGPPIIAEPDRNDPHLRLEITRGKR